MDKNESILIVDDVPKNIQVLGAILKEKGYNIIVATNGKEALGVLETFIPDLILLDVMMPGMDGFEVCSIIKNKEETSGVPIIFLTAKGEVEDIVKGFASGASDYVQKPFRAPELISRVSTHLENKRLRNNLELLVQTRTMQVEKALAEVEQLKLEIIKRLGRAAEYRDNETGTHIQRMGHYSVMLAKACEASKETLANILEASMMHDVGKIGIPDRILLKPNHLTPEEFEEMKKHTIIGAELLSGMDAPLLVLARTIAISHHEKWNGTGYPYGLMGEEIPLESRIVAITDVFDALTSKRPYKEPWPEQKAYDLLESEKGKHFDPHLVDIFLSLKNEIREIQEKFKD
jgi:putative two-component system response regulator